MNFAGLCGDTFTNDGLAASQQTDNEVVTRLQGEIYYRKVQSEDCFESWGVFENILMIIQISVSAINFSICQFHFSL